MGYRDMAKRKKSLENGMEMIHKEETWPSVICSLPLVADEASTQGVEGDEFWVPHTGSLSSELLAPARDGLLAQPLRLILPRDNSTLRANVFLAK